MIGRAGKPYTVVGAIGQGVVGYRPVGKQGRYRVRVEHPDPYGLKLYAWNVNVYPLDGSPKRSSVLVNSKAAMQSAVSMAFAALMIHEAAKQLPSGSLDIGKKVKLPPAPEPEEEQQEEFNPEGEWCENCQCYHH
jgi:hypothetical protein